MFDRLVLPPVDPLLSLMTAFQADPCDGKIDLGVGVYRDETGRTPVMAAVKEAEARLLAEQDSKSYLGSEGDVGFVDAVRTLALGDAFEAARTPGLQTPGGTGALRLAIELYTANMPDGTVWIGTPTWPVHETMLAALGARVRTYPLHDRAAQAAIPDALADAVGAAQRGDLFLLQGGCHNPTGAAMLPEEWARAAELFAAKEILPLVDLAYHGLGRGLDEDAAGVRLLARSLPRLLLAYSCDKNFGLYRDRVGAVHALCRDAAEGAVVKAHFARLARNAWSMPPDHGGALVRIILQDEALTALWKQELAVVQVRLGALRRALAAHGCIGAVDLSRLADQEGMFALLPLDPGAIERLRTDHAIYMAGNGRINIAGLSEADIDRFVGALRAVAAEAMAPVGA